jgi:hypothetical protein
VEQITSSESGISYRLYPKNTKLLALKAITTMNLKKTVEFWVRTKKIKKCGKTHPKTQMLVLPLKKDSEKKLGKRNSPKMNP